MIPARFRVVGTKRPTPQAGLPGLRPRGPAGAGAGPPGRGRHPAEATVAHVLVSRYAEHLPLCRQAQILARQGIEIGREVLAGWTGTAAWSDPLVVDRSSATD